MAARTVQAHVDDSTPADGECERGGLMAEAIAKWGRARAKQFPTGSRPESWLAFADYVETLDDDHEDIQFFNARGAFVPMTEMEFWSAHVPPLQQVNDFLGTIGAMAPAGGSTVMAALIRAVELHGLR